MAISVGSRTVKSGFLINATSADASAGETMLSAVASKAIKIRALIINSAAAITITIGEDLASPGVGTVLVGPIAMAANSTTGQMVFNPPLELTEATALTCDASGAGVICIIAQGVIE